MRREARARRAQAVRRVHEGVQAHGGEGGQARHRIEGAEHDDVVRLARVVEPGARVGVDGAHAGRGIRTIGVAGAAQLQDGGVDLDGVDLLRAVVEQHGHVVAGSGPHHQRPPDGRGHQRVRHVIPLAHLRVAARHDVAAPEGKRDLVQRSVGRDLETGGGPAVPGRDRVIRAVALGPLRSRHHQQGERRLRRRRPGVFAGGNERTARPGAAPPRTRRRGRRPRS